MKRCVLLLLAIAAVFASRGESVSLKNPGYFKTAIRDGYPLFPDSLVCDSDTETLHLPAMGVSGRLGDYPFTNLKKIIFEDIDYVPGGLFVNMANLEEVVFNGMIGHFDCSMPLHCPKLRKITFKGPVSSTGAGFAYDCEKLDSVVFESVVVGFGLDHTPTDKCPNMKYIIQGALLEVLDDSLTPPAELEYIKGNPRLVTDMERLADWQSEVLRATDPGWMRRCIFGDARVLQPVLAKLGSEKAVSLKSAMDYAWGLGDDVKTHLDLLRESPEYEPDSLTAEFVYAQPTDSMLTLSRERFALDSIAGEGDDISRIKNLLYWVHDNIRHDGSKDVTADHFNLREIYDASRRDSIGVNCRGLAICLTEALLSVGIPAKYLTCQSKAWETDNDCHVICAAWSESLGKWIWVDPTFAAYVTDENGLLLHPGEVRNRLRNNLPLVLNSDANWNHEYNQTKDYYLDEYMAKNLYIISANTVNQAEPEGPSGHRQGVIVALVPKGVDFNQSKVNTTDEDWFWKAPSKAF